MAYTADIQALSPSHHFKFDGNATDEIAALASVDTSMVSTDSSICNDATYCMTSNAVDDYLELDDSTAINQEIDRLLLGGWFQVTKIQQPPTRIYGDGGTTASVSMHLGFGNQILFETDNAQFTLQIYGGTPLVENRSYHLALRFESDSYGNFFKAYLDGVLQTDTANNVPNNPQTTRAKGGFGGKASGLSLGGTALKIVSVVNGKYNHWAFWHDVNAVAVTDSDIRTELFEKGAPADVVIASDTQANMQTALDVYSGTTRGNHPLCFLIEEVAGGGDLHLDANNITFDKLASLHIRYLGTGTLYIYNKNGSDVSIVTSNVSVINLKTITLTNLRNPTEVRIFEAGTTNEIVGQEDVTTGTFSATIPTGTVDIRIVSLDYKIFTFYGVEITDDKTIDVVQFFDSNYLNPYGIGVEYHILDANGDSFNDVNGTYFRPVDG